jgi:large conductance mechanosensitive channel
MIQEFKSFIARGNVIDMAVGVIIGGAFGKIVSSLTEDLIMPPIGMVLGKVDFASLFVQLAGEPASSLDAARQAGVPILAYGNFVNQIINFLIIAFCVFLLVKAVSRLMPKKEEEAPAGPAMRDCPECCSSIPAKARRCSHCTAVVEPTESAA